MRRFALDGALPSGRVVLEASAGTGKTYSLTALVVRHLLEAGATPDAVLVVTFTRAAANELRDRTRTTLEAAEAALRDGLVPADAPWMQVLLDGTDAERSLRLRRAEDAIAHFDDLTITTIHGFCQQSLAQLGVRAGSNPDAVLVTSINDLVREVCRDTIVAALADEPAALCSNSGKPRISNPKQAETELRACVVALTNNPAARHVPDPAFVTDTLALRWAELAVAAREEVVRRQAARSEIGYDTLISGMHRALHDERHGDTVAAQLADRYSVVLVDEFQDTDQLQWEVFDRAFSRGTLITVGDPKQAIYRFRGADVHAYLAAVAAGAEPLGLTTNHRSDRALLDGVATLFEGATLGDSRIPFVAVEPRAGAPVSTFRRDGDRTHRPAVDLRVVVPADELALATSRVGELSMPAVRSLVLADLVGRVVDLLDHGRIGADPDTGDAAAATAGGRPVEPGDIAVLVPSHLEANNVAEALRRAHVPAVRTRTGSVLKTAAAAQWRLLLAALAQPHQTPVVRAGALGWFLATDLARLTTDEDVLADLQVRAADLGDRLRVVGVSAFYDEQKAPREPDDPRGPGLVATVLAHEWGERHLTDLDHISELLATATQHRATDPAQVLRILDEMIAEADDPDDAAMRRIDSDARAVQITTVHSAKGLEFPIVLVPFAFKRRANISTPMAFVAPEGHRTLDLASRVQWAGGPPPTDDLTTRPEQDMRRYRTIVDIEGDELRLLYVALTRAKHRLEVWWASTQGATTSALGRILLDRYGAGPVQNSASTFEVKPRGGIGEKPPAHVRMAPAAALQQIRALVDGSDGALGLTELAPPIDPVSWSGRTAAERPQLRLADRRGRTLVADPNWKRWSFTRIGATLESAALDEPGLAPDAPAERGGYDEPVDDGDDAAGTELGGAGAAQLRLGIGPVAHLAPIAGGARFGTFVHSVFEHVDFASPTLEGDVDTQVLLAAAEEGLRLDEDLPQSATVAGIVAAIRTPLGPISGDRALADIPAFDRLNELAFDLPLRGGAGGVAARAGAIGEILLEHLPLRDRLRPFAKSLAGELRSFELGGWLNGSIDAVLRVSDGDATRFVVIDYKTNRLHAATDHDPLAAYRPDLLVGAMEHSRYPLQALIYTVALHRYLRWRLGDRYRPDEHLGGVGYLFVRGMVGPATPTVDGTPHGVFAWRPPAAAILAIDRLFATGASS